MGNRRTDTEIWHDIIASDMKQQKEYGYSDFDETEPLEEQASESTRTRLFVDMDGTLAVWHPTKKLEELYEEGYFKNLEPYQEVVNAIKTIINSKPDIEVFILSAYLSDSSYALQEKNEWLDKYLPEIDRNHRCFCHCGTDKSLAVPDGIKVTDVLLDDYTLNLKDWCPPGVGIKLLNGINDTHKTWQGERVLRFQPAEKIAEAILNNIDIALGKDKDDGVDL